MVIVTSVIAIAALAGLGAYAFARRWPDPVEAPRIKAPALASTVEAHTWLARFLQDRRDPVRLTGLALTVAISLIALGGAGIGILLAMVRTQSGLAAWDLAFARFGAAHASGPSTTFLRDVSLLGGYEGVIVIGAVLAAVEWRRIRSSAVIGFVILALGGQFAIAALVKALVGRDRPSILHLTGFSGSSFPSGHAVAAATTFMSAALLLGRGRTTRTKAVLAAIAVALAVAVASTRVLLGVHWLTDALAGLLMGWGWFACCSIAFGGRLIRFATPAAQAEAVAERVSTEPAADLSVVEENR